jgi:acyl-CoA synthetase (AMP-forming)/AMP-acid ligase II
MASDLTFPRSFLRCADRNPAAPALISHKSVIDYQRLAHMVAGTTLRLRELDIQAHQHVGVTVRHQRHHLVMTLSLAQLGAVSVPVHPKWPESTRVSAANDANLACLVGDRQTDAIDGLTFHQAKDVIGEQHLAVEPPQSDEAPKHGGRVFFSLGSAGQPKLVLFDAEYLDTRIRQSVRISQLNRKSRVMMGDLNFAAWGVQAVATLCVGGALIESTPNPTTSFNKIAVNAVSHALLFSDVWNDRVRFRLSR